MKISLKWSKLPKSVKEVAYDSQEESSTYRIDSIRKYMK
jgi:hypothetical protein